MRDILGCWNVVVTTLALLFLLLFVAVVVVTIGIGSHRLETLQFLLFLKSSPKVRFQLLFLFPSSGIVLLGLLASKGFFLSTLFLQLGVLPTLRLLDSRDRFLKMLHCAPILLCLGGVGLLGVCLGWFLRQCTLQSCLG